MTPFLLDVNILNVRAMSWFTADAGPDWLSCPPTQNSAIRIMSGLRSGPTALNPAAVTEHLQPLMDETHHRFTADVPSLLRLARLRQDELKRSRQVTNRPNPLHPIP